MAAIPQVERDLVRVNGVRQRFAEEANRRNIPQHTWIFHPEYVKVNAVYHHFVQKRQALQQRLFEAASLLNQGQVYFQQRAQAQANGQDDAYPPFVPGYQNTVVSSHGLTAGHQPRGVLPPVHPARTQNTSLLPAGIASGHGNTCVLPAAFGPNDYDTGMSPAAVVPVTPLNRFENGMQVEESNGSTFTTATVEPVRSKRKKRYQGPNVSLSPLKAAPSEQAEDHVGAIRAVPFFNKYETTKRVQCPTLKPTRKRSNSMLDFKEEGGSSKKKRRSADASKDASENNDTVRRSSRVQAKKVNYAESQESDASPSKSEVSAFSPTKSEQSSSPLKTKDGAENNAMVQASIVPSRLSSSLAHKINDFKTRGGMAKAVVPGSRNPMEVRAILNSDPVQPTPPQPAAAYPPATKIARATFAPSAPAPQASATLNTISRPANDSWQSTASLPPPFPSNTISQMPCEGSRQRMLTQARSYDDYLSSTPQGGSSESYHTQMIRQRHNERPSYLQDWMTQNPSPGAGMPNVGSRDKRFPDNTTGMMPGTDFATTRDERRDSAMPVSSNTASDILGSQTPGHNPYESLTRSFNSTAVGLTPPGLAELGRSNTEPTKRGFTSSSPMPPPRKLSKSRDIGRRLLEAGGTMFPQLDTSSRDLRSTDPECGGHDDYFFDIDDLAASRQAQDFAAAQQPTPRMDIPLANPQEAGGSLFDNKERTTIPQALEFRPTLPNPLMTAPPAEHSVEKATVADTLTTAGESRPGRDEEASGLPDTDDIDWSEILDL
ncbi:hypothetical protein B0A50_07841 [Salinomyces thailandicus]|uniref:Uncharacterized protein n=1 Tax=Salinomyces thailandicus TaxID=706561 RepID=A0A4U0TME0_9PEZI|nr:hypothetical protein B0A50_07841 [Salinomyces thailandica]